MSIVSSACLVLSVLTASPAMAQVRQEVLFEISHDPPPGRSVFVRGNLEELGGNNLARSVRLGECVDGVWRVRISLPVNRTYAYRFYERIDDPALIGDPFHGVPISSQMTDSTDTVVLDPSAKMILYHSTLDPPVLHWRQDVGPYETLVMNEIGPGRVPGEKRWLASDFGEAQRTLDFFVADIGETQSDPVAGSYVTPLDAAFLQDGELFTYFPAPVVSPQQRDYEPSDPPAIQSTILGNELRKYRVMLPRGYAEHPNRNYPVLYLHDGQFMWDASPPGDFDVDGSEVAALTRNGLIGELIMVGIDSTANRTRNYLPPGDMFMGIEGEADQYVAFILEELKPVIDAEYRTQSDAEHTFTAGYSFGGVVALYMGWDYSDSFRRVGSLSGSFWLPSFTERVMSEPWRDIAIYLDSGNDNYVSNVALTKNLICKESPYVIEESLRYRFGVGLEHNNPDFAVRIPDLWTFLLPGAGVPNEFVDVFMRGDCDGDGAFEIGDPIYSLNSLFLQGSPLPPCLDSCDGNDDGELDLSDPISFLAALFLGGAPPEVPFPDCGTDPTADTLGCLSPPSCP